MLKYCLDKWNENKSVLEARLKADSTLNSCQYIDLVKLVVDCILNYGIDYGKKWDSDKITVIDNGEYQGTQLFLIPKETYQPSEYEYLMTYVNYGSCTVCDTLQAIQGWHEEPLTEKQVGDFMQLCKDLLTNMIKPYNSGWREDKEFEQVSITKKENTNEQKRNT